MVQYFLMKYSRRMKKTITSVPPEAMQALMKYSWPGNVRELEHLIERAVILSTGPDLKMPAFDAEFSSAAAVASPSALEEVERQHILNVLRRTRGKVAGPGGAAERLGMNRTTLNSRMRKLGISRQDFSVT